MNKTTEQILNDLFEHNYALKQASILNDKVQIVLKSLTAKEQLEIDEKSKDSDTYVQFLRNNTLVTLAYMLKQYSSPKKQMKFEDPDKALDFLKELPVAVVDAITQVRQEFDKEVRAALNAENLDENFTTTPSTESESN